MRTISVIGGSQPDDDTLIVAEELGSEIGKRRIVLVCGGVGGIMEAACKGAKTAGGLTVGIIPQDDKPTANPYVDIVIPTGLGFARNFLVAKTGDAVVAIDGSAGTLSEMAIAWFSDKPIVAIPTTGGWAQRLAGTRIDSRREDVVYSATTPKEAVDYIFKVLGWE